MRKKFFIIISLILLFQLVNLSFVSGSFALDNTNIPSLRPPSVTTTITGGADGNASSICSGDEVLLGNGTCFSSSTFGGGTGGNPFDQVLNTTSNVTFHDITATGNVTSSGWFNGLFNWVINSTWANYFSFNGEELSLSNFANESWSSTYNATYNLWAYNQTQNSDNDWILRNSSMDFNFNDSMLSTIYYNATQSSAITGTIDGGTLEDTQHQDGNYDGNTFNFSEESGSPGLDLRMNFTGVIDFNQGIIRYKTSALKGDYPIIQLWSYTDSDWEDYPSFAESESFATITQPVFDATEHLQDGVVQMRIYKSDNGKTQNHYYVDWVAISKGYGTPSGQEIDPYSYHRNSNLNASGYNITANYGIFDNVGIGKVPTMGVKLDVSGVIRASSDSAEPIVNHRINKIVGAVNSNALRLDNSNNVSTAYGEYRVAIIDNTAGAEKGQVRLRFMNTGTMQDVFSADPTNGVVFNDAGTDISLRIVGDTDALLFWVRGDLDKIGIGKVPTSKLDVDGEIKGTTITSTGDTGGISIYAQANISASGFITRTSVFDSSKNAMDYIQDSDYYLDKDGKIDHKKFYGYTSWEAPDKNRPVIFNNVTSYPYNETIEGVRLEAEIDVLRQAVFDLDKIIEEQGEDIEMLKLELCIKDNTYKWCK